MRRSYTAFNQLLVALLTALALAAAGCSSGGGPTTTEPSESVTTTTTPETTTPETTTVSTTTTAPATVTTAVDTNTLAQGSGCTPGTNDGLPDGEWFGYVDGAAGGELDFDLACWFSGEGATLAAAEDGEESPPPNDYYVRNVNPTNRTLTVGAEAAATWMSNPGDPTTEVTGSYTDWLGARTGRGFQPGVWLTIEASEIVNLREQYVP